jgi:hypothetical protein
MKRTVVLAAATVVLVALFCNPDNHLPVVSLVSPVANDTLVRDTIVIRARATDTKALDRVEFYVDDSLVRQATSGVQDVFSHSWNATLKPTRTAHVIRVRAVNGVGNSAQDSVRIWLQGTAHAGPVRTNEVWTRDGSPHLVKSDVSVGGGAVLTIEPGCRVSFGFGTLLSCGDLQPGGIKAIGRDTAPIRFTSANRPGTPGDWRGIALYEMAGDSTRFSHCIVEFGGAGDSAMVRIETDRAQLDHCVISRSQGYGVQCLGQGRFIRFDSNTVTECARYPLRLNCRHIPSVGTGNSFVGNSHDGIEVDGDLVTEGGTWPNPGVPYFLNASVAIGDLTNRPVVVIAPGTTVKCARDVELSAGLSGPGGLIADGDSGQIVFTSAATSPAGGDWRGITFSTDAIGSSCILRHCRIEYGGAGDLGNILIRSSLPEIRSDSIGYSGGYGIYLTGTQYPPRESLLANNTFYSNTNGSIGGQ